MRRRGFLALTTGSALFPVRLSEAAEPVVREEDPKTMTQIGGLLKQAGVGPVKGFSTRYYMSAGDVPLNERRHIGLYCDGMLVRTRAMFASAGVAVMKPRRRFNLVMIADAQGFSTPGRDPSLASDAAGFYDPEVKAVFFSPIMQEGTDLIDWEQTMVLVAHEAMHQITLNLGLIDYAGDTSPCILEGLAGLAEDATDRSPTLTSGVPRSLRTNVEAIHDRPVSMELMFTANKDFYEPIGRDDRYAQSWLLVRTLLTAKDLTPKFRTYLKAIAARRDDSHRLDDAREHLGNLDDLLSRSIALARRLLKQVDSRFTSTRRSMPT